MTMSPYILVLAKNTNEGAKYIQRAKLPRGRWRNVASAKSIRGIRKATVHCLPGFSERPDRHSILAELRYAKCDWFDVEMPEREKRVEDQGDGMGPQMTIDDISAEDRVLSVTTSLLEITDELEADISDALVSEDSVTDGAEALDAAAAKIDEVPEGDIPAAPLSRNDEITNMPMIDTPGAGDVMPTLGRPEGEPPPVEMPTIESPKARRRARCLDCGVLHFKDEECDEDLVAPIVKPAPAPSPTAMFI